MASKLLTTAEAAAQLGKSHGTISRWVRDGKLRPAVEGTGLRGARFFRTADIQRLKQQDRNAA